MLANAFAYGQRLPLGKLAYWTLTLALLAFSQLLQPRANLGIVGKSTPVASLEDRISGDPLEFSAAELQHLQQRFGVHGPQPRLAQLFTAGLDHLEPLRGVTYERLEDLRPIVVRQSRKHQVNPMLVMAVLFDELQHVKPGETTSLAAQSGLFSTLGPAQLGLGEMTHQGLLGTDPTPTEVQQARERLLDPEFNVTLLVGKFARLSKDLGYPRGHLLSASASRRDAKSLAVLAYLHNGKLDYPRRILRYMQDPQLHALLYGERKRATSALI